MKRKVLTLAGIVLFLVACGRANQSSSGDISRDDLKNAKAIRQQTKLVTGYEIFSVVS